MFFVFFVFFMDHPTHKLLVRLEAPQVPLVNEQANGASNERVNRRHSRLVTPCPDPMASL